MPLKLSPADRARLETLFDRAADLPRADRAAFVERECASNDALRAELSRLVGGLEGTDYLRHPGPAAAVPAGARIGPYRLLRPIGEGGMGTVFEAEQERPHRVVALKLLRADFLSPQALRRFEREGEFLARLHHPGIAAIHAAGTAATERGPQPWFAMERIHGVPLTEHARARGLSVDRRVELLARVADAVQHAHRQGVIHRDLKPANILVDEAGQPKIVDFGIARASESDVQLTTLHTDAGQILGTLAYMSPEQASGDPDRIDTRSDVYSLGVVLYELLTDELPYDLSRQLLPDAVRIIREQDPRRPSAIRSAHRGDLETIVLKALEKDPDRRYESAAALAADLRCFLRHEPIAARPTSRLYTLRKFVRRNKTGVSAALAVCVALLVGIAASVRFGLREAEQRRAAEADAYRANLSLAQAALREGNFAAARELQGRAPEHLRNWEWRHLDRQQVRERARVAIPDLVAAAFLDAGRVLAVDRACGLHLWDVQSGAPPGARPLDTPGWPAGGRALALSADGRWLLTHADGSLALGGPLVDRPPTVLPFTGTPKPGPRTVDVAADGARVVVVTEAEEVVLLDAGGGARAVPTGDAGAVVGSVRFDAAARTLLIQTSAGLRAVDTDTLAVRFDDTRAYEALAWSPDGATLAVETRGRSGQEACLYFEDALTGGKQRKLPRLQYGVPHFERSVEACFGPQGRLIAVAFTTGEVCLADTSRAVPYLDRDRGPALRGGASVGRVLHEGSERFRLAFSPDGASLMTLGVGDGTLRVWAVGVAEAVRVCAGHTSYAYSVSFSPDGATLASGSWDGSVRLWDSATGESLAQLTSPGEGGGASSRVLAVACSPDGRSLARMTGGTLALFNADLTGDGTVLTRTAGSCVAYSANGALLAADERGHVHVRDARSLEELDVPACSEGGGVVALALDAAGRFLATGTGSATVRLFELPSGAPLAQFTVPEGPGMYPGANSLAFDPAGARLAVGFGNSVVSVLEVPSLDEVARLNDHAGEVLAVALSPDGTRLASGGRDRVLRVWDAATGHLLLRLDGPASYIKSLAFSPPDGRRIAAACGDGTVHVWDAGPDGGADRRPADARPR